ncbi:MAG: TlpA disulfide reductase family protein [Sulfolobales archaeon]
MAKAKSIRGGGRDRKGGRRRIGLYISIIVLLACCGIPLLLLATGILGIQQSGQPLAIPPAQVAGTYDLKGLVVRTIDGEELSLGDAGGKPRVLVAVATWCGTCAVALMSVREAVKQFGDNISVVVIGVWSEGLIRELSKQYSLAGAPQPDTPESLKSFVERFGDPRWKIVLDSDAKILKALGLRYIDAVIVLDRNGREVYRAEPGGYARVSDIASAIEKALKP